MVAEVSPCSDVSLQAPVSTHVNSPRLVLRVVSRLFLVPPEAVARKKSLSTVFCLPQLNLEIRPGSDLRFSIDIGLELVFMSRAASPFWVLYFHRALVTGAVLSNTPKVV